MLIQDVRVFPRIHPLWWRLPLWALMTAYTVGTVHHERHELLLRVLAGVLMGGAALTLQSIKHPSFTVRRVALVVTTVTALAACFAAPNGIAEIPVLVAAARAPEMLEGRALRWFVVLDTIAFGATVGWISHSLAGLLAGAGVPLLVERAIEQQELIRERDRAQALLAEAQRARESQAQAAALQERGRIAREMHDVLAHSLAGLSMQLQGLRAVAAREQVPSSVLEPLDNAAALAREGLSEARAAVGALRDPVGLGLDALPALIERHPGAAQLHATGDAASVPPEVGHVAYRAVQEALTNAARYAPGSTVTVTADARPDRLRVTVQDGGPAPGRTAVRDQGTGLGLAGMADRVREVGGTLTAGPREDGGWEIVVDVPVAAVVAP